MNHTRVENEERGNDAECYEHAAPASERLELAFRIGLLDSVKSSHGRQETTNLRDKDAGVSVCSTAFLMNRALFSLTASSTIPIVS